MNETELEFAPEHIKDVKNLIPTDCIRYIEIDDEVEVLTQTINRLDCLISWNFKHIVNFDKIKMFNSINLRLGYPLIDIRSPLEFLKNDNN